MSKGGVNRAVREETLVASTAPAACASSSLQFSWWHSTLYLPALALAESIIGCTCILDQISPTKSLAVLGRVKATLSIESEGPISLAS